MKLGVIHGVPLQGCCYIIYNNYTEAGKAIGFALEQPLHVVALPCSALLILKRLQHTKHATHQLNSYKNSLLRLLLNLCVLCAFVGYKLIII
ncbi:MAG: hypothetical protein LBK06_08615 [Planctomycetaceae bacterium]|nr:hypothetical protein [Planctomycetaceae bacterium]